MIDLAAKSLDMMSEHILEEIYYWCAIPYLALGNRKAARKDPQARMEYHPGFEPALAQLKQLTKATP